MSFWKPKKQKKCDRCGKVLMSASAAPTNKDTEIVFESTGEIICFECLGKMMEGFAPSEETGPEADRLISFITQNVAKRTKLPTSAFKIICKSFVDTDVTIKRIGNQYEMIWYYFIKDDPEQLEKAIDYVVNWIDEHPISQNKILPSKEIFEPLVGNQKFVFFFTPEEHVLASRPELTERVLTEILPSYNPRQYKWKVWTVPKGSDAEQRSFMASVIKQWTSAQIKQKEVLFDQKGVTFSNGETITCIIGYLKG